MIFFGYVIKYHYYVLKVGYGEADLGITNIWYLPSRQSVVDYSVSVGDTAMKWISKPPEKLTPVTNIIRTFDSYSWLMIGVSIISFIVSWFIVSRLGQTYGVQPHLDNVLFLILPLGIITADFLPQCFRGGNVKQNKTFFSPGFAGNGLLLLWIVSAGFISMAFQSNIRAILMIPSYEEPVDSTDDLLRLGKIPIIGPEGGYWREYLLGSALAPERRAGQFTLSST